METQTTRMPRPQGTTLLCMEIYKAKSDKKRKEKKEYLLKHLVNVYTMNGFRLNGYSLNISQFSNLLGVKQERIQNLLLERASTLKAFSDPDQLKDTANALASMCTTWAIQDRGLIQSQAETMLRAQNGTYKPFISAEVRQTLAALLQSNKQIAEIFKTFYSQGGINISLTQTNQKQENYLTIDKAYEIARESTPTALNPADPAKAQILSDSTLKAIAQDNHIEEASNILRQYEHLDNSGWEKASPLGKGNTTHPQQKILEIDSIGEPYQEAEIIQESSIVDVSIGEHVLDSDTDKEDTSESGKLDKGISPESGKRMGWPAASKMGILPDTEGPLGSCIEGPESSITPSVVGIRKKKRPKPDTTKRPKNYTLSGTQLGKKAGKSVIRTGTQKQKSGTPTEKPDNLDRHLNSDHRRAISRIDDDSLPSRSC